MGVPSLIQYSGDLCHQIAIVLLLFQLRNAKKNASASMSTNAPTTRIPKTLWFLLFTYISYYLVSGLHVSRRGGFGVGVVYDESRKTTTMWYVLTTIFMAASVQTNSIGVPFHNNKNIYRMKEENPFSRWRFCSRLTVLYMAIFLCCSGGYKDYHYYHFATTGRSFVGIFLVFFEAMAMLPKVVGFRGNSYSKTPRITTVALFLGLYRILDVLRWGFADHPSVYPAGSIQALLYMRFFYECNKNHGLFRLNRFRLKIEMHWDRSKNQRMGFLTDFAKENKHLSLVFGDGERDSSSSKYQRCRTQDWDPDFLKSIA